MLIIQRSIGMCGHRCVYAAFHFQLFTASPIDQGLRDRGIARPPLRRVGSCAITGVEKALVVLVVTQSHPRRTIASQISDRNDNAPMRLPEGLRTRRSSRRATKCFGVSKRGGNLFSFSAVALINEESSGRDGWVGNPTYPLGVVYEYGHPAMCHVPY